MGLTKPIEQKLLSYQGTFMYLKNIIREIAMMKKMYTKRAQEKLDDDAYLLRALSCQKRKCVPG